MKKCSDAGIGRRRLLARRGRFSGNPLTLYFVLLTVHHFALFLQACWNRRLITDFNVIPWIDLTAHGSLVTVYIGAGTSMRPAWRGMRGCRLSTRIASSQGMQSYCSGRKRSQTNGAFLESSANADCASDQWGPQGSVHMCESICVTLGGTPITVEKQRWVNSGRCCSLSTAWSWIVWGDQVQECLLGNCWSRLSVVCFFAIALVNFILSVMTLGESWKYEIYGTENRWSRSLKLSL